VVDFIVATGGCGVGFEAAQTRWRARGLKEGDTMNATSADRLASSLTAIRALVLVLAIPVLICIAYVLFAFLFEWFTVCLSGQIFAFCLKSWSFPFSHQRIQSFQSDLKTILILFSFATAIAIIQCSLVLYDCRWTCCDASLDRNRDYKLEKQPTCPSSFFIVCYWCCSRVDHKVVVVEKSSSRKSKKACGVKAGGAGMINSSPAYLPRLEALHSLMIGIALTLITFLSAALVSGIINGEIWNAVNQSFHSIGMVQTFQGLFFGLLAAVFGLGFFYALLLLLALPQYFLLVLPLLKFFSTGLQSDVGRHWVFYVVSGILTGGLPWLGLTYFLFGNSIDFNDTFKLFALPAFLIGAIAGAVLKYRLTKLAATERIESNGI
jgi:uncharacterized membrane protein